MSTDETPPPNFQLKEWFNADRYHSLAGQLGALSPGFEKSTFLAMVLEGLEDRSLLQRLSRTAVAMQASLPGGYRRQISVLKDLAPQLDHEFIAIVLSDFVAQFGRETQDRDFSLEALKFFTCYGSAEFAIRFFLQDDLPGTLAVMQQWTQHENEKIRRLASEGCRPRLPWGQRLQALVANPEPLAAILEPLKADPALFVRKSVANNLNDIAKDHPDWVLARLGSWDRQVPETGWIAKHAARTLIKQGNPRALGLFGFGEKAAVEVKLSVSPEKLALGGQITLRAEITALASKNQKTANKAQQLAVDYIMHYARPNGTPAQKVFKWTEVSLPAAGTLVLEKRQTIRDFTTRKHYAGDHILELQINGQRLAKANFQLHF